MAKEYYSVRTVVEWPSDSAQPGHHLYEERITLWKAESLAEAIDSAQKENKKYCNEMGYRPLDLYQAYRAADLEDDKEVFSLLRGSKLNPSDYLDAFFDTGTEHQSN